MSIRNVNLCANLDKELKPNVKKGWKWFQLFLYLCIVNNNLFIFKWIRTIELGEIADSMHQVEFAGNDDGITSMSCDKHL